MVFTARPLFSTDATVSRSGECIEGLLLEAAVHGHSAMTYEHGDLTSGAVYSATNPVGHCVAGVVVLRECLCMFFVR